MNVRSMALAVIALTTSMSTASVAHSYDGPEFNGAPVVVTEAGPVRGTVNPITAAFLGIPYAEPPVGNLRWRPPVPGGHWTGVLDAALPGKHCPQTPAFADPNASEACLFLNVYVPLEEAESEHHSGDLPVMVWLYGGSNASGASEMYDPTPLVQTGHVIAITLNYRVGVLGFLAHPGLDAEDHAAANYGLQDQQLALKWVQTNIRKFGGDPQNVTIFGESAGGLNAFSHLVSPRSAGLYHRAIIQSGAYQLNTPSLSASESLGVTFANAVGCSDQTAACLRATPVADLVAHGANAFNQSTVDGQVLPETPLAALTAGHINRVPVMQGANGHEGRFFVSPALTEFGYQLTIFGIAAATGKPADQIFTRYPLVAYSSSPFESASGNRRCCLRVYRGSIQPASRALAADLFLRLR
jgi:para-nitrobenzyl esterase